MIYIPGNGYASSEIYHHGVKGQRWGVRRYRNEDGSLTAEGKEHLKEAGENAKAIGILSGIAGGIVGAAIMPRTIQRGADLTEAILKKSLLKNSKHVLYNNGSEIAMRVLGAIGGATIAYKVAKNGSLRLQGYNPKKYKQAAVEERNAKILSKYGQTLEDEQNG